MRSFEVKQKFLDISLFIVLKWDVRVLRDLQNAELQSELVKKFRKERPLKKVGDQ